MPTDAPLLLLDSAGLYFRAYFGIPESSALAPDGQPVNAVRGFLDGLATLVRARRPGRICCALDEDWRPAWRVALIPSYKAHRLAPLSEGAELVPDPLAAQVPIILAALAAFGIATVGAADYEADDVIATLATREPGPVEVATGDRDLIQLVDDDRAVRVLYFGRGIANLEVLDDAAVVGKYGVLASQYADLAILRGDASDGLPGVSGVGEKTAVRLIQNFGSLDAIVAAAGDRSSPIAPGVRAKVTAARDYLAAASKVVYTVRDIDLPVRALAAPRQPSDEGRLAELARSYNLGGPVRRLTEALASLA